MGKESHKSLFVKSLGKVAVRGLTPTEAVMLRQSARQTARGVVDAEKWIVLVGVLTLGMVKPRINRDGVEVFIKAHARDAAKIAKCVLERTNERILCDVLSG